MLSFLLSKLWLEQLYSCTPQPLRQNTYTHESKQRKAAQTLHSGRPLKLCTAEDRSNPAQRKTARDIFFSNRLEHIRAEFLSQATCNARSPINQRMPPSAATSHISAHTNHPCRTSDRLLRMFSGFAFRPSAHQLLFCHLLWLWLLHCENLCHDVFFHVPCHRES